MIWFIDTTDFTCTNNGETYQTGQCRCGTVASCVGNDAAPTCDAANNICVCEDGSSHGCTRADEICRAGACVGKIRFIYILYNNNTINFSKSYTR